MKPLWREILEAALYVAMVVTIVALCSIASIPEAPVVH